MTLLKHANRAFSTLASGITDVALSLSVSPTDGAKFPASGTFNVTIFKPATPDTNREIVAVTARTGDVFTITRGAEGTTPVAHDTGDYVWLNITSALIDGLETEIGLKMATANDAAAAVTAMGVKGDANPLNHDRYAHPNHTGQVTSVADGATTVAGPVALTALATQAAQTVLANATDGAAAPTAIAIAASQIVARLASGNLKGCSIAEINTLLGASGVPICTATGTVDAILADYTPDITLADMKMVAFVATGANTSTTPSFAPDGLTAHTIVKNGGAALVAGDIPAAGAVCLVEYNLAATRWELLNPAHAHDPLALPLAGGTMSGDVAMGDKDITGLCEATFTEEHANTSSAGAATINWATNGPKQKLTLQADTGTTVTFTAPTGTCNLILRIIQAAGYGGTITWPATVMWPDKTAPTLTNTASAEDIASFFYNGTNYYGMANKNFGVPA